MRLLLITDTHGRLGQIDALASANGCNAVLHAGDFGFYDDLSVDHLSERELDLRIVHSDLSDGEKRTTLALSPAGRKAYVRDRLPLSELPVYLRGQAEFANPMYAVWGNHEDTEVVRKFWTGEYAVPNLHILDEKNAYLLDRCDVFGLGGNLLSGKKFFQRPIAGGAGRIWTTLSQYGALVASAESDETRRGLRILVSHVSPGKEAFVSLVGACLGASVVVSGHMAPPFPMCWNEFAIRTPEESVRRLDDCLLKVSNQPEALEPEAREAIARIRDSYARCLQDTVSLGRGTKVPRWYRDMIYLNLPDYGTGHAVLGVGSDSVRLETYATRERFGGRGEPSAAADG